MPDKIGIERFLGYTDLPVFGKPPGWLTALDNMRVMPGGYLEARGGNERIMPSGGTATAPLTAGLVVGAHEHTTPNIGWLVLASTGGTVFSANQALKAWYYLWDADPASSDAIYYGSDARFSRVVHYCEIAVDGATAPTFAYEFYNGSTWTALTTTSTPDFTPAAKGEQLFEWAVPSTWAATPVNGVLQYWVRIRMTNNADAWGTRPAQSTQRAYADWIGNRQIYIATADGAAGAANAAIKRYGQSGTTASWTDVGSSLFSGNFARARFASYRGVLYYINGKDQKRWNQETLSNVGFTAPSTTGNGLTAATNGAGNLTGIFSYAITYGYGPNGEWGESNERIMQYDGSAAATFMTAAANAVLVTFNLTGAPASGIADVIYVYRTPDLASAPAGARSNFPYYRIATVTRNSTGSFPTTYADNVVALPFPPIALNIAVNTPPSSCRYITVHKNRIFLGSNNQYPGRVWWSQPFQAEAFVMDEDFADFTRSTGGILTGIAEFNDQVVVFTEDQMFGIANVDTDTPSIYVIHPGVGCVAPDSIAVGNGVLGWLSRGGVYLWDGEGLPQRITADFKNSTFGRLTLANHGGSRGIIHNRLYELTLQDNTFSTIGASWEYNIVTKSWSLISYAALPYAGPLITVTAPLGHADVGVRHPLRGPIAYGTTDWHVYIGEYTTVDHTTGYTLTARVHFGPMGYRAFSPNRLAAYYDASGGLAADPTMSFSNAAYQWATPGLATAAVDTGTQYQLIEANVTQKNLGSGGIAAQWQVTTTTGGTLNAQRLHSIYLEGEYAEPRRR